MSLLDQPLKEIRAYMDNKRVQGRARELPLAPVIPWATSPQIVLREDMGLELGKPGFASRSVLLWGSGTDVVDSRITLVGHDFWDFPSSNLPFAQFIMVGGRFGDEYECYRDLRDASYGLCLNGFMMRFYPSRQSIWCRVSREALASGFGVQVMGSALIQKIKNLDFVDSVEVLFITSSKADVDELDPAADLVLDVVKALMKMCENMNLDCDSCEYVKVCASVEGLRHLRKRLQAGPGKIKDRR